MVLTEKVQEAFSKGVANIDHIGITFTWRLLLTIFFILIYANYSSNHELLVEIKADIATIKHGQNIDSIRWSYAETQHIQIVDRLARIEPRVDIVEGHVYELSGYLNYKLEQK